MAEYIERAAALSMREPPKSNRYYQTDNLDDAYGQGWDDALCCIERLPVADVVPVVYGRWISVPSKRARICSRCLRDEPYKNADDNAEVFEFCPHCGAKMDEGTSNAVS